MELLKKERNVIAARLRIALQRILAVIQLLASSNKRQFVRLDRAASTAQWVQLFTHKSFFFIIKKIQHSVPTRWIYLSRCIQWMWLARDVSRYERSVSTRCLQKKRKSVWRRCLSESNRLAFHQVFIATTIYMKLSLNPNRLLF